MIINERERPVNHNFLLRLKSYAHTTNFCNIGAAGILIFAGDIARCISFGYNVTGVFLQLLMRAVSSVGRAGDS